MHEQIQRHLKRVKGKKAEASYETHRTNLRDFDAWLQAQEQDLTELSTVDLEDYFIGLIEQDYAPNTIASRFESVRALFSRLAGRFEVIEDNPFNDLERKEFVQNKTKKHNGDEIVYLTPEEKEALCDNVPSPTLRNELIIRLMWQTGIRQCELTNIELADLDRENRCITVWSNKSKEKRTVFYQPSLDLLLDQWLDGGYRASYAPAEESSYLFVTERSEQLGDCTVNYKIVKPAAEAAGIQGVMYKDKSGAKRPRVTAHALRHGHAVYALKSGIDVRTVQKHLGHSSLEITMNYLQLIDEDVKDAYHGSFVAR